MKRPLRWIGIILGSLAGIGIVACAVVYFLSERVMQRTYPVSSAALTVPTDAASIAEGRRLATVIGCFNGCHGRQAEGGVFFDEPMVGRLIAPNLTAAVRQYSDAQFAVAVRKGLRPDGRSMFVMPSESFAEMTDADLARIIAFLKSLPPAAGPGPEISLGPLGRVGVAFGKFKTAAQLAAEAVPPPQARNQEGAAGRYLAQVVCSHCHGTDLRGDSNPEFTSPDLRIVGAYSPEAFTTLMRTGKALGGREIGMMSAWARNNLAQLSDAEIAALYGFLHSLAAN